MTPQDTDFLHGVALNRAGLNLGGDLAYVAETRLSAVARREGADSAADLVARARTTGDARLIDALVEALAPQDGAFFRDPAMFARLVGETIPQIARSRASRTVRVWSAGCGAGQEIYSLALAAAEQSEALRGVELQLFGSDLSARQLQKARAGVYSHFEVQRGLPIRLLLRSFAKADDMWRIEPDVRQRVRWARINLMDSLASLGGFDVILCRDVLPHMDPVAARGVAERLAALLPSDGRLVLGAREPPPVAGWVGSGGVFVREAREVVQAA